MLAEVKDLQNGAVEKLIEILRTQHKKTYTFRAPTGERVIIMTGCINALVSKISGTLIKNNSCIA